MNFYNPRDNIRKWLFRVIVFCAVYSFTGLIWRLLEIYMYGSYEVRDVDTIMGSIYSVIITLLLGEMLI